MSLSERIATLSNSATVCATCRWYATLCEKDQKAFDDASQRPDIALAALLALCKEEGLRCEESSLRRHVKNHGPR